MNIYTVAIGESYEREAERLKEYFPELQIHTINSLNYEKLSDKPMLNGLLHKSNFINYFEQTDGRAVTIRVNANPGTATCTPSIATAKGYTVIT